MFILYIFTVYSLITFNAMECFDFVDSEILTNLTIHTFLDQNRNIRLNLTWNNVTDAVDQISIRFLDTDGSACSAIDGVERFSVDQDKCIIIPPLNLENPADNLANGCEYKVFVETHDLNPNLKQLLTYQIPDCVQDKCICQKKSPYQLYSVIPLHDDIFKLNWKKLSNKNLTLLDVYCMRENNFTALTQVKEMNVTEDSAEIALPDVKNDVSYRITGRFYHDGCYYASWTILNIPTKKSVWFLIFVLALSAVLITLVLFAIIRSSVTKRKKLKKYNIKICCYDEEETDVHVIKPLSHSLTKEEFNSQYTPLDFDQKKYDKYEFPSNKVVIKEEIGKGAFGTVYYAQAFEITNNPGYTKVAVKRLREGASVEEEQDLLNEIKILKKVGEHKNIVQMMGCITIEKPYMLILELAPCGSLKEYLLKLREKWTKRRSRFFFADDTSVSWVHERKLECEKLNYTKVVFETTDDSYITPDSLPLNEIVCKSDKTVNMKYMFQPQKVRKISEKSEGPPQSPTSVASSALSCAETDITTLTSLPPTPNVKEPKPEYVRKVEPQLDNDELQYFALQIASGMKYLEQINVTHRDLAARNILLADNKVLKISDFGLSRMGTYVSKQGQKLPLRWMSIEAIEEKTCTNKSDVWSYAVVLWEIGTLGAFPYPKTHNNFVLYELKMGKRLERPKICTDDLYNLMLKCWSENPVYRPTFCEIVEQLDSKQKKVYVDFNKLSFDYIFPSSQEPESI